VAVLGFQIQKRYQFLVSCSSGVMRPVTLK
jgi:hypothetical protein